MEGMDGWERRKGLAPLNFHVMMGGGAGSGGGVIAVGAAELMRSLMARLVYMFRCVGVVGVYIYICVCPSLSRAWTMHTLFWST